MNSQFFKMFFIAALLISIGFMGCHENPVSSPVEPVVEDGSWMIYSPYKWTHDGKPYYSVYCNVYSDGASDELKQQAGVFADAKFLQVLSLFNFTDMNDLRYPPGYNKIHIYLNRYHEESIAAAYWGSVFITIRTATADINRYDYLFRHELTHVFEFLIEEFYNIGTDVWFCEGIAIYGGGGLGGIQNIADLDQWIAQNASDPKLGNPIQVHVWDDFPPGADITGYYYTVFDLTMRYFLDPDGLGKSTQDVLNLFYAIRNDVSFPAAFQEHFGISLEDLEDEYYDRMRTYLVSGN